MARFIIVELESGEQMFFDRLSDGFRYAKTQEDRKRHSVEYIGTFTDAEPINIYKGQYLRWILRSVDNVDEWIKAIWRT